MDVCASRPPAKDETFFKVCPYSAQLLFHGDIELKCHVCFLAFIFGWAIVMLFITGGTKLVLNTFLHHSVFCQ